MIDWLTWSLNCVSGLSIKLLRLFFRLLHFSENVCSFGNAALCDVTKGAAPPPRWLVKLPRGRPVLASSAQTLKVQSEAKTRPFFFEGCKQRVKYLVPDFLQISLRWAFVHTFYFQNTKAGTIHFTHNTRSSLPVLTCGKYLQDKLIRTVHVCMIFFWYHYYYFLTRWRVSLPFLRLAK